MFVSMSQVRDLRRSPFNRRTLAVWWTTTRHRSPPFAVRRRSPFAVRRSPFAVSRSPFAGEQQWDAMGCNGMQWDAMGLVCVCRA